MPQLSTPQPPRRDGLILAGLLAGLLALTGVGLVDRVLGRGELAPYCLKGQEPELLWGFGDLAGRLEGLMGEPLECEHGESGTADTWLKTTTGQARYRWCTNTPTFNQGHERWAVVEGRLVHWIGESIDPPGDLPIVQRPDLRRSCSAASDRPPQS